jgi:hypothetical protein
MRIEPSELRENHFFGSGGHLANPFFRLHGPDSPDCQIAQSDFFTQHATIAGASPIISKTIRKI